jgi:replicative DNA helicase
MISLNIHKSADRFDESGPYSASDLSKVTSFGVDYLDKSLKGILPTDLVLLAADSGCGKTELVTTIALNASATGKRVLMFALEAEDLEIERRIKFKLYSEIYTNEIPNGRPIEFDEWLLRRAPEFELYTDRVRDLFETVTTNLNVCYKKEEDFGVTDFEKKLMAFRQSTDLVIVDHLHYFDITDQNELMALGKVAKKIRHMALQEKLPIILVCHVRKKERGESPLIPEMEDIFGTSDVFKNATKVIMMSGSMDVTTPHLRDTFIRTAKYRHKGSVKNYIAKVVYNTLKNAYEPQFQLGLYKPGMKNFTPMKREQFPWWAK